MVTSIHAMIYSDDATATRAFLRDVLLWPFVEHAESESGWLIFRSGLSEIGVHPTVSEWQGKTWTSPRHHSISLMCDDLEATIAELARRGAEFSGPPEDHGYGLVVMMKVPGADDIQLYQPTHPTAFNLP
jgi:predicted enzyme related to lactoylglutathione lyase